jgi:hypothetical protein
MSAGNLKNNSQKGNNFPYQFKVLQLLGAISGSSGSGATEATAQQILQAIQDGQDFESRIVIDDGGDGDAYIEVRIWNPDTQTWEDPLYYAPGSNTGVPSGSLTAPIVYQSNTQVLADIYTEVNGINNALAQTGRIPGLTRVLGANPSNPVPDTVTAGARSVSFFNAGPVDATVAGGILKPGESVGFRADAQQDILGAIQYITVATGDLVISEVR